MDAIGSLWGDAVQILGWTLLHFLWQGTAIALIYALLRTQIHDLHKRYALGVVALAAMALCPLVTVWQLTQAGGGAIGVGQGSSVSALAAIGVGADNGISWRVLLDDLLPWIVGLWLLGVACLSINSLRHWFRLQRMALNASQAMPEWDDVLKRLCQRFAVSQPVRLLRCAFVDTPTLIGWLKPVILLPLSVVGGFTPQQIELILAHELGHVRRWDYLVNLFQVVVETILFYHPAVHWISRDVRNTRESCCDDLVLQLSGANAIDYAQALADLEEVRSSLGAPALAASGGVLLNRIRRIVGAEATSVAPLARNNGWLLTLLVALTAIAALRPLTQHPVAQLALPVDMPSRMLNLTTRAALGTPMSTPTAAPIVAVPVAPASVVAVPSAEENSVAPKTAPPPRLQRASASRTTPQALFRPQFSDLSQPLKLSRLTPLGDATEAPQQTLRMVQPRYPTDAMEQGIEGRVELTFAISRDGSVRDVRVVSALPPRLFEQASIEALRQWRFDASSEQSVGRRYHQTFDFALNSSQSTAAEEACRASLGTHICRHIPGEEVAEASSTTKLP